MLHIELLGTPHLRTEDAADVAEPARLVSELLGILIVGGESRLSRDRLADLLWPEGDVERRLRNLSTTLWRLRKAIEVGVERGTFIRAGRSGFVSFNRDSTYSCDVEIFESVADRYRTLRADQIDDSDIEQLRAAIESYQGELLQGIMSEWVFPHRDRLSRLHQDCVLKLMLALKHQGRYDESVHWAQAILAEDPLREDVHRTLIEVFEDSGQPGRAIAQYNTVREILEEELQAPPSTETQKLYYRVTERRAADDVADSQPKGGHQKAELGEILDRFAGVQRELAEGMQLLAGYLGTDHV